MAIDNPIIAAGSTVTRANTNTVVGKLSSTIPPGNDNTVVDGIFTPVDQSPQREGQMLFVVDSAGRAASVYIVIETQPGTAKSLSFWRDSGSQDGDGQGPPVRTVLTLGRLRQSVFRHGTVRQLGLERS